MFEGSSFMMSAASPTSPLTRRTGDVARGGARTAPAAGPAAVGADTTSPAPSPQASEVPSTRVAGNVNSAPLLQSYQFPVSEGDGSSRGDSLAHSLSSAGAAAEDPVRKVFPVPPPLVVCLVQHLDRDLRPVTTPACVDKCVEELQNHFSPSVAAEQVCGSSAVSRGGATKPATRQGASRVGQGSHPGSRLQLQFGKARNVYANAGAAILNILIYSVDEPYSRPRVLAHIAKAWREELAKTGSESACLVLLHHKGIVGAAEATQQLISQSGESSTLSAKQSRQKLAATSLGAATASLEEYFKELQQLKFSAHQMCAYTPHEAPVRVLERLHTAAEEKLQRLKATYEQYLVRKRTMPLRPVSGDVAAVAAAVTAASVPSPAQDAYWDVQQLWRLAQDLAQHCLQFGLVKDARAIYERAFLVYYNSSDDFPLVEKVSTLEALGKTPGLLGVRDRAGAQLTNSGYPRALTRGVEVVDGLLFIAACAMQCAVLDNSADAARHHFDMLMQVVDEKFEESRNTVQKRLSTSPGEGRGAGIGLTALTVHQQFFSLQCYLSAMRSLWPSYGFSAEVTEWKHVALDSITTGQSGGPTANRAPSAIQPTESIGEQEKPSCEANTVVGAASAASTSLPEADLGRPRPPALTKTASPPPPPPPPSLTLVGQDAAEAAVAVGIAMSRATFDVSGSAASVPTTGGGGGVGHDEDAPASPYANVADLRFSIIAPPPGYAYAPPPATASAAEKPADSGAPSSPPPPLTDAERLTLFVEAMELREEAEDALTIAPAHLRAAWRRVHQQYRQLPPKPLSTSWGGEASGEESNPRGDSTLSLLVRSNHQRARGRPPVEESVFLAITYLVALGQELGLVSTDVVPTLPDLFDPAHTVTTTFAAALTQLKQGCRHLSSLTLHARACVAYLTHALGYQDDVGAFDEAGVVAKQCTGLYGMPDPEDIHGICQAEEMQDGASLKRLWQRLTLLSAATLSLVGAHRREFYLYAQLTLSCLESDTKRAATLTIRRLLPCVRDVGWGLLEYAVRRLYVECVSRLWAHVLPQSLSSPSLASTAAERCRYLYATDAAYALYKECVLYLVHVGGSVADGAEGGVVKSPAPVPQGASDAEALVACALALPTHTREEWWQQMRQVDQWMVASFLRASGPLRYRLDTFLQSPRITVAALAESASASDGTTPLSPSSPSTSVSQGAPTLSLGGGVRIIVEGVSPVDPLMAVADVHSASDGVEGPAEVFLLTLESRKDWLDEGEPTHVVRLPLTSSDLTPAGGEHRTGSGVAPYLYEPSSGLLRVGFVFKACHAGVYRVRSFELRVGASWFLLAPQGDSLAVRARSTPQSRSASPPWRPVVGVPTPESATVDEPVGHNVAAASGFVPEQDADDASSARRRRLEEQFAACVALPSADTDMPVVCPAVLFRVKEPESRLRLRAELPALAERERHLFADTVEYITLFVETDEPLAPAVNLGKSAHDGDNAPQQRSAANGVSGPSSSARALTPAQRALRQQQRGAVRDGTGEKTCVYEAPVALLSSSVKGLGGSLAASSAFAPAAQAPVAALDASFVNAPLWATSRLSEASGQWGGLAGDGGDVDVAAAADTAGVAVLGLLTLQAGGAGAGDLSTRRAARARSRRGLGGLFLPSPTHYVGSSLSNASALGLSMQLGEGVRVDYAAPAAVATAASPASVSLSASTRAGPGRPSFTTALSSPDNNAVDALDMSRVSSNHIQFHRVVPGLVEGDGSSPLLPPSASGSLPPSRVRPRGRGREDEEGGEAADVAPYAPQEQMRVTVVDDVAESTDRSDGGGSGTNGSGVQASGPASTVLPVNERGLLDALPVPSMACRDAHTDLPSGATPVGDGAALSLTRVALVPTQKRCVFQLASTAAVSNGSGNNSSVPTPHAHDADPSRTPIVYAMKIPLLPIFMSRQPRGVAPDNTHSPSRKPSTNDVSVAFTCWRGGESTSTRVALSLPFRSAVDTTYAFKHFQGHVYCLVTMRNVLDETSLWLRGAQLHVLDASPTYEVVRVSDVYDHVLTTEWKAGECFQLLFELALCSTYLGTDAVRQHRVQLSLFYSDWNRTFVPTPAAERLTLRLMDSLDTEQDAESVCVEDEHGRGVSPHEAGSCTRTERRHTSVFTPLHDAVLDGRHVDGAARSLDDSVVSHQRANQSATSGRRAYPGQRDEDITSTTTTTSERSSPHSSVSGAAGKDGANSGGRVRSAALRYNPVTASVLAGVCNRYMAPVATFSSKHMCLFSAVMYAESPWTQRFGATMNYSHRRPVAAGGTDSAHLRSHTSDLQASRPVAEASVTEVEWQASFASGHGTGGGEAAAGGEGAERMGDAMVDTPADFVFVAGEPVRFCVRLEPHAQNWPEDAGLEEDFIVDLKYNPRQWMVIGKKRERRTLSLMEEVTVTFTAVPLLPPSSSAAAQSLARMSGTASVEGGVATTPPATATTARNGEDTERGASERETAHLRDENDDAPTLAAPVLRPAGSAVVDEGIIDTPTVEMFWADRVVPMNPGGSRAASPVRGEVADRAGTGEGREVRLQMRCAPVLFDLVQFRASVRVCKRNAAIRRGGGTDRPLAPAAPRDSAKKAAPLPKS